MLYALLFIFSGCRQDHSLSPPADSEKITVAVKLPNALKTETLWAVYRSATCKRIGYDASGQRTEREGYHSIYKELERQGESDIYQVELPRDGGGACRWQLSNVTFGVVYADPVRLGANVTIGSGGGVIVIFDHNNSPRGGADTEVDGDLTVRKDYYPWVKEAFIGGHRTQVGLVGEGGIYLKYKAPSSSRVVFEPLLHPDFLVHSVQPKMKKKGSHTTFTYPDGSVTADGRTTPDFRKLQAIRLAAEAK